MAKKNHIPVPKDTKAVICANCGAVALDANNICKVQGIGKKSDWCGVKSSKPPKTCHNKKHTDRWQCRNCGQTSVNPLLLCDPEKIDISD
jgi:ribosomal protein S27AE